MRVPKVRFVEGVVGVYIINDVKVYDVKWSGKAEAFNTLMTEAELGITPRKLPRLGLRFGLVNSRGESLRSNEGLPKAKSRKLGKRVATFNNAYLPAWMPFPEDARKFERWCVMETDIEKLLNGLLAVMSEHPLVVKTRALAARNFANLPWRDRAERTRRALLETAIYNAGILATYVADEVQALDFEENIVHSDIHFAFNNMALKDFDDDFQETISDNETDPEYSDDDYGDGDREEGEEDEESVELDGRTSSEDEEEEDEGMREAEGEE